MGHGRLVFTVISLVLKQFHEEHNQRQIYIYKKDGICVYSELKVLQLL
jgi:hypothetical protein